MILKDSFVHHVHFWLNDKADSAKFINGLQALTAIKSIKDIHIGIPASTSGGPVDNSYDVSLLIIFNSQADHDSYDVDPIHQEFIAKYAELCSKVVVQDSINV
ncbi:Dabb family protein [Mucilaginibacter sp.]